MLATHGSSPQPSTPDNGASSSHRRPVWPRVRRGVAVVTVTSSLLGAGIGTAAAAVEGVDVSRYQHGSTLNWSSVRAAGQSFAVVKASEGRTVTNSYLASDVAAARKAGLVTGGYHFARPDSDAGDAVNEARHFVAQYDKTGGFDRPNTLPPVLDLEANAGLGKAALKTWVKTWLDTVEDMTGRTPMIYVGRYFWNDNVGSTAFSRYPLWIAQYTSASAPTLPMGWSTYALWQHTSTARVAGIAGNVDHNRFKGKGADLAALSLGDATRLTLAAPDSVTSGSAASLTGRLTSSSDKALAGKNVRVYGRAPGSSTWNKLATLPTASDGTYTLPVSPEGATEYTARYSGDIMRLRASAAVSKVAVSTVRATRLTVAADDAKVTYDDTTMLRGALTAGEAGGVAGAEVRIQRRVAGATSWSLVATVETDENGQYVRKVRPHKRTDFRARYAGDSTHKASGASFVTVAVGRTVSARLSNATPDVRTTVYVTGKVTPARAGSTVYRQRYADGAWHRAATTTVSATGFYRFAVTPKRHATYTTRVAAPYSQGLARSLSRTLTIRVS